MAQVLATERDAVLSGIIDEQRQIYVIIYADDYSWEFIQATNEKQLARYFADQRVIRPVKCIFTYTQVITAENRSERVEDLLNKQLVGGKG